MDQPAGELADILLGNVPVFPHNGLLDGAGNMELQERLVCMFKQILALWKYSGGCLKRAQYRLPPQPQLASSLPCSQFLSKWVGSTSASRRVCGFCELANRGPTLCYVDTLILLHAVSSVCSSSDSDSDSPIPPPSLRQAASGGASR